MALPDFVVDETKKLIVRIGKKQASPDERLTGFNNRKIGREESDELRDQKALAF